MEIIVVLTEAGVLQFTILSKNVEPTRTDNIFWAVWQFSIFLVSNTKILFSNLIVILCWRKGMISNFIPYCNSYCWIYIRLITVRFAYEEKSLPYRVFDVSLILLQSMLEGWMILCTALFNVYETILIVKIKPQIISFIKRELKLMLNR